jgi:hypothetical protein
MFLFCPGGGGPKEAAKNLGGLLGIWARNVSPRELSEPPGGEKACSLRMVLSKEQKEPLARKRWGFSGMLGSPEGRRSLSVGRLLVPQEGWSPWTS